MELTKSDLQGVLPLVTSGKVRDLYEVDASTLLFVATDRISAYDVIMENGIPNKGTLLTLLTSHWFSVLRSALPSLRTHFLTLSLPSAIPPHLQALLRNRSMQVRRLRIFPLEAIVRGYITGSAWSEYRRNGTVNGQQIAPGLQEAEAFSGGPIFTPSTKAEPGAHDENISIEQARGLVGEKYARRIEELALQIYGVAREYAWDRGIIIADTKFEFGLDEETDEVVLVDEVLTPDSSRFWPRSTYGVGRTQESFDKQFLRDWLVGQGLKGKHGVTMPEDVVVKTGQKYGEVFEILTGTKLGEFEASAEPT